MKNLANTIRLLVIILIATVAFGDSSDKKAAIVYNPVGKRDPFKVLNITSAGRKISAIYPTEKYDLDQLSLKAIIRLSGKSRAMVEAPDGQTFIIYEGETVGRERATLSRILKTEIIFTQQTFNYLGSVSLVERVLSLPSDNSGLATDVQIEETEKIKASTSSKKTRKGNVSVDSGAVKESKQDDISTNVQKILNMPNELEKELDEAMGKFEK